VVEAFTLSGIIVGLALIREPLGFGTISVPGGAEGIIELFDLKKVWSIVPISIISVSGGGLLLFGYVIALYRYLKTQRGSAPKDDSQEENR
jgi:uncharacterized membrane protein